MNFNLVVFVKTVYAVEFIIKEIQRPTFCPKNKRHLINTVVLRLEAHGTLQ